jgi:hypothetical protein
MIAMAIGTGFSEKKIAEAVFCPDTQDEIHLCLSYGYLIDFIKKIINA